VGWIGLYLAWFAVWRCSERNWLVPGGYNEMSSIFGDQ
jgi:hypothetical protein